ncbi:hypothetical protein NUSPORA_01951 [Nucleospora cyclopteri]
MLLLTVTTLLKQHARCGTFTINNCYPSSVDDVCPRPNLPPRPCPPQLTPKPHLPNDLGRTTLYEIALIVQNLSCNLTNVSSKEINAVFERLYYVLLECRKKAENQITTQKNHLEHDILQLINNKFDLLFFVVENFVIKAFNKSQNEGSLGLAAAKLVVSNKIEALKQLTDAEIKADLLDTTNGFLKSAKEASATLTGAFTVSFKKQEDDILSKINQSFTLDSAAIVASIVKLFAEYDKSLKAVFSTLESDSKRAIEYFKNYLESCLIPEITELINRSTYLILTLLKDLVKYVTGCDYLIPILPLILRQSGHENLFPGYDGSFNGGFNSPFNLAN